jgi:hypothetical protein
MLEQTDLEEFVDAGLNSWSFLSDLSIASSSGYAFDPDVVSYSGIRIDADSLAFTPTQGVPGEDISYAWNGTSGTAVSSGNAISGLAFAAGANKLVVTVVGEEMRPRRYAFVIMAYTVSYRANGATSGAAPARYTGPSGRTTAIAAQGSLANAGLDYRYWYTNPIGSGGTKYLPGANYTIGSSDLPLYAIWENASVKYLVATDPVWTITGNLSVEDLEALNTLLSASAIDVTLDLSGATLTALPDDQFDSLPRLSGIAFPTTAAFTTIGWSVFDHDTALAAVNIPGNVATIGPYAFWNCTALVAATLHSGLASVGECCFSGCTGLTTINIPGTVATIGDNAFNGCSSIASITIPASVTSIGSYAFQNNASLVSVTMQSDVPPSLGASNAFTGNPSLQIHVPSPMAVAVYQSAPVWSDYAARIIYP